MLRTISVSLAVAASLALAAPAMAASAPLSGWGWSSTIGWVSFNSADSGAGGGPYGVQVSTSTGAFSGYAWSPNVGWISFNPSDLSNCPTGSCPPIVNMSNGSVSGWARALAGAGRTDGWDGWIELAGTNHASGDANGNGGVTYVPSTGKFTGFAWGGNVVGWLQFSPSICSGSACTGQPGGSGLVATCSESPLSPVGAGSSVTFSAVITSGAGGYSYSWSTGATTASISQTYSSSGPGPSVTVTDSSGNRGTYSCDPVIVATVVSSPHLWIDNSTENMTVTTAHVRSGANVKVDFAWPSSLSCSGAQWPSDSVQVSGTSNSGWLSAKTNGSTYTFQQLPVGLYDFSLSCADGATPPNVTQSNTVTITVSPSIIQEQ